MRIPCNRKYVFAVYSFDSRTGDLLRNGHRLRITEQARHVLRALLENPGSVVTREELRQLLWPGGETLDWDHSINKVVAQLRGVLRDDARETKFIETVPKRGYRFIPPVRVESEQDSDSAPIQSPDSEPPETPAEKVEVEPLSQQPAEVALPPVTVPTDSWRHPFFTMRAGAVGLLSLLLVIGTLGAALRFWKQPRTEISVGIPPFEASGDGSQTMAESFRLDLASAVADLPSVRVRAAHSLTAPLSDDQSIRAAAYSLHLDVLLFGRLVRNGERYDLNLEVVQGSDAAHLASFHYSGSSEELGSTRDRIQRDLFDRLGLAEGGKWRALSSTLNPKAYRSYLQGRLDLSGWSDAPVENAQKEFEAAIQEDAGFANAYAGLASANVVLAEHGAAPRDSSYRDAQQAAERALALAPASAEAHAILGQVALRRDWNFELAERELRRAISLDPNQPLYHLWLSVLLCDQSRSEESLREIEAAHALDPLWAPIYRTEVFLANAAGQYSRALESADKLISLMPNWALAYDQRAWTYWHTGRYEDAITDWRRMAEIEKDTPRLRLEDEGLDAFRRGGVVAYAQLRLKAIQSGYPYKHAAMDFVPAEWYCIAGEYDKALSAIDKMLARHDPDVLQLAVNHTLNPLHEDARFRAALIRAGIHEPRTLAAAQSAGSSRLGSELGAVPTLDVTWTAR